jgi:hypothetical protein
VKLPRVGKLVPATLLALALAMELRGALYWQGLITDESLTIHGDISNLWLRHGIYGAVILLLGLFAIRGSKVCIGLMSMLMAWYARGSYSTAVPLSARGPAEREIAQWALRTTALYLLLVACTVEIRSTKNYHRACHQQGSWSLLLASAQNSSDGNARGLVDPTMPGARECC